MSSAYEKLENAWLENAWFVEYKLEAYGVLGQKNPLGFDYEEFLSSVPLEVRDRVSHRILNDLLVFIDV